MLKSGSSGSVRGVLSNEHPYREPGPIAAVHRTIAERRDLNPFPTLPVSNVAEIRLDQAGSNWELGFAHPSWPATEQDRKVTGITASGHGNPDNTF